MGRPHSLALLVSGARSGGRGRVGVTAEGARQMKPSDVGPEPPVLVLSQCFLPEGAQHAASTVEASENAGHTARVFTRHPNYPEGRLIPGYRQRWRGHEIVDGTQTIRVPLSIDHSDSFVKRDANCASFGASSASALRSGGGADAVYVYATQMTAALGPWICNLTGGVPYALHIQDLWPVPITGSSVAGGTRAKKLIETPTNPWLASVCRHAARIVVILPSMKQMPTERGVETDKIDVIYNWAHVPEDAKPLDLLLKSGPMRLLYAGNLGELQDLETVVRVVSTFDDSEVHLTMFGNGRNTERLKELVRSLVATNRELLPDVPHEQNGGHLASWRVGPNELSKTPLAGGGINAGTRTTIEKNDIATRNAYLDVLSSGGLLGATLFLYVLRLLVMVLRVSRVRMIAVTGASMGRLFPIDGLNTVSFWVPMMLIGVSSMFAQSDGCSFIETLAVAPGESMSRSKTPGNLHASSGQVGSIEG